jgi:hypothetical protein
MCNLYSITTNQAAIINLIRVINRYVGNLAPMPGVFPDYPAPVVRNTDTKWLPYADFRRREVRGGQHHLCDIEFLVPVIARPPPGNELRGGTFFSSATDR